LLIPTAAGTQRPAGLESSEIPLAIHHSTIRFFHSDHEVGEPFVPDPEQAGEDPFVWGQAAMR
jgi:hypothetical protein